MVRAESWRCLRWRSGGSSPAAPGPRWPGGWRTPGSPWAKVAVGLALAGTAFFFCDALITPAISVLSAVEGLELLSPDLKQAVVPITLIVLTVLFPYQRHGTARVGSLFGPIMVVWFVVIAAIGIFPILRQPQVLPALHPPARAGLLLTP